MSQAQMILFFDNGTIRAEMPSITNGSARNKIDTSGISLLHWPKEIVDALLEQQARLNARDEAAATAAAQNAATVAARSAKIESEKAAQSAATIGTKKINRAEIHDNASRVASVSWVDNKIGPRRRGKRFDFIARHNSKRPWITLSCYDETPTTWCARNGWELQTTNGKIKRPTTTSTEKRAIASFQLI